MLETTLKEIVLAMHKGTVHHISYEKPMTVYKRTHPNDKVTKQTEMNIRVGVTYDNMKYVNTLRRLGILPQDNQGLNGVEWEKEDDGNGNMISLFPFFLRANKSRKLQLRCYKYGVPTTKYFLNGVEVTKADLEGIVYDSELHPSRKDIEIKDEWSEEDKKIVEDYKAYHNAIFNLTSDYIIAIK